MFGTFSLLQSAFDRMGANVLGIPEIRGFMAIGGHFSLMLLFVFWDRIRHGYLHPATKWGTILLFLFYLITPALAGNQWWREAAAHLAKVGTQN